MDFRVVLPCCDRPQGQGQRRRATLSSVLAAGWCYSPINWFSCSASSDSWCTCSDNEKMFSPIVEALVELRDVVGMCIIASMSIIIIL